MINPKTKERELCFITKIDAIEPIVGSDNCEAAVVGGWRVMTRKGTFQPGDLAVYFEIDSKVPETETFDFLAKKHYKIKTQKYTFGGKGNFISQGLLMAPEDFGWEKTIKEDGSPCFVTKDNQLYQEGDFLTQALGVTYAIAADNKRKSEVDKYKKMAQRRPELFKKPWARWMMKRSWGKKVMFFFFGKKKDVATSFPTKFPYIRKTDQERAENMTWVLEDKTPYIVTQKCDGSSGTFILERKPLGKFEFYVCSRNVRQLTPQQQSFYDENYYWEVAIKYDIENKLKDYLKKNPELEYVCWQGEVCSTKIQGNPHGLSDTHLFLFHMIDSKIGKYDIREAAKIWKEYNMEVVPIIDENYILPDDFEEFKLSADTYYDASVCGDGKQHKAEGYVYYKTTDPNFSFKNVSREYLLNH